MTIYTEIRKRGGDSAEASAVHETTASAHAWLRMHLSGQKDLSGRFYGRTLSASEIEALRGIGRTECLP